jgi:hypothetical protein
MFFIEEYERFHKDKLQHRHSHISHKIEVLKRNATPLLVRPFAASRYRSLSVSHALALPLVLEVGTEILLRELTLSNTLSSNPKSSRSVDLPFSHKLQFYLY